MARTMQHNVSCLLDSPGLYTRKYELKKAEADSHSQLPLFMLRQDAVHISAASTCKPSDQTTGAASLGAPPVAVNEQPVKGVAPSLPADVQIAARQEARNGVPGEVMHPAFPLELRHDCVYPRVPGPGLVPGLVELLIVVPRYLLAHQSRR